MTNGETLKSNFPGCIDKAGDVFSAIFANQDKTGAVESALNNAEQYTKDYTQTTNIYDMTQQPLDNAIKFFSYLERITNESEESIKNRFKAIFVRGGDSKWGSVHNIKHVFEQYFMIANIFVCENVNDTEHDNLIDNYDFATDESWLFEGNAVRDTAARFSKSYGALIPSGSENSVSQDVNLLENNARYYLHFMMKGDLNIEIICDDTVIASKQFTSDKWINKELTFAMEKQADVTIKITGGNTESYFDYVRLFKKADYPSFCVIAQFEGNDVTGKELALAKDLDIAEEYAKYHDKSYLTGIQAGYALDVYQDLLNYLRPVGVKAYLTILTKDVEATSEV